MFSSCLSSVEEDVRKKLQEMNLQVAQHQSKVRMQEAKLAYIGKEIEKALASGNEATATRHAETIKHITDDIDLHSKTITFLQSQMANLKQKTVHSEINHTLVNLGPLAARMDAGPQQEEMVDRSLSYLSTSASISNDAFSSRYKDATKSSKSSVQSILEPFRKQQALRIQTDLPSVPSSIQRATSTAQHSRPASNPGQLR